jgi:hypothetical protein
MLTRSAEVLRHGRGAFWSAAIYRRFVGLPKSGDKSLHSKIPAAPELQAAWEAAAAAALEPPTSRPPREFNTIPEQFLILVTCRDEQHQVELLSRLQTEGLECRALLS